MSVSKLDGLIGLDSAKRVLEGLCAPECSSHAVLLYGGEGSGKTTLARFLAQSRLCLHPGDKGPCGACPACDAFERSNCADFLLVEPQPPSNLIRVNQVHPTKVSTPPPHVPILTFLRTAPIAARGKVVLIEHADRMNGEAANALLKTLEEPDGYATLILTTQSIGRLLPTILSRCVAVACPFPGEEALRGFVPDISDDEARVAGGSVGEALRLKGGREVVGRILAFVQALESRPTAEALRAADEFRAICDAIAAAENCNARQAQAEALKLLTRYIIKVKAEKPDWAQATIEAHRRIVGNAGAGPAFDSLFAGLLLSK